MAIITADVRKHDLEAERLRAEATQLPLGSRLWRLLRAEAQRLDCHGVWARQWLTEGRDGPGQMMAATHDRERVLNLQGNK